MLSAAKHLVLRPFASLRVTHKCANLVWFDLVPHWKSIELGRVFVDDLAARRFR
jgi:hypothetical protein